MHPRSFALDVAALLLLATIIWVMLVLFGHVRAEPMPYPKPRDGQCAGSYVQSGSFCVPKSGGTVRESIPKPLDGQCPSGWASGASSCEKMR